MSDRVRSVGVRVGEDPRGKRGDGGSRRMRTALALISVSLIGMAAPAEAYRTGGDLPKLADTERVRWGSDTIHYDVGSTFPQGLMPTSVEAAVAAAFDAWSSLPCPTLTFVPLGFTPASAAAGDGRVTLQWVDHDWTALGFDATAAATTDVIYERGAGGAWRIVDADVYLNTESFAWTTDGSDPTARDLQAVLAHEVGHVVGLLHPCEPGGTGGAPPCDASYQALTMYPEYEGVEQRTLEADDRAGACFLYEPAPCAAAGCAAGMECTLEGCAAICGGSICAVGERCGPHGCTTVPCAPGSCEIGCDATCDTPGGADGDPCAAHLECASGHCGSQGACAPTCAAEDLSCSQGYLCNQAAAPPECVPDQGVLGDACATAAECQSGYCLLEAGAPSICTRECGNGFRTCPVGYSCGEVDGVAVCIPDREPNGCAVGRSRAPAGVALALALGFLLLVRKGGNR